MEFPPYARLLRLTRTGEGADARVIMPFDIDVMGRPNYLHGGAIAGLLEFAAYSALREAIDDDAVVLKPVTVTVDYMRGASMSRGDSHAVAVIERLGNRIANIEATAWQTDRAKPIAAARINYLVERP